MPEAGRAAGSSAAEKTDSGTPPDVVCAAPEWITKSPDWEPSGDATVKTLVDWDADGLVVRNYIFPEFKNLVTRKRRTPLPPDMYNEVSYGDGVRPEILGLRLSENISMRKIQENLKQRSGGVLQISIGCISGILKNYTSKSETERERIRKELQQAPAARTASLS